MDLSGRWKAGTVFFMQARILICVLLTTASVFGQGFINGSFERSPFQQPPPSTGFPQFLDWATWAPGWSHSSGDDTGVLYYDRTHLGISQWYLLVRNPGSTFFGQPLAGSYSLAMHSGYFDNQDFNSPWTEAFISQTAIVPADTLSLRLLASGSVNVFANGNPVPLVPLGGNQYGADFSPYAGLLTELKISNVTTPGNLGAPPTILDNISFSSTPVPEPGTLALLILGGISSLALRTRKRRS